MQSTLLWRWRTWLAVVLLAAAPTFALDTSPTEVERERWGINPHTGNEYMAGMVDDLGMKWVRIDMPWPYFQPNAPVGGNQKWDMTQVASYRRMFAALKARKIQVLGVLTATPAWAARSSDVLNGQALEGARPRNITEYVTFVNFMVDTFGADVKHWNLWNEPNCTVFWRGGDMTDFANTILVPGANALHARQAGGKVVGPDFTLDPSKPSVTGWFSFLNTYGHVIDIVDLHYYRNGGHATDNDGAKLVTELYTSWPKSSQPWECTYLGVNCQTRHSIISAIDGTAKTAGKPVWVTETGVDSKAIGEAAQATQLGRMYDTMQQAAYRRVSKVFVYEIGDSFNNDPKYGLVRAFAPGSERFSPKPAYLTLQSRLLRYQGSVQLNSVADRWDCKYGGVPYQGRCVTHEFRGFNTSPMFRNPTTGVASPISWGVDSSQASLLALGFTLPPNGYGCNAMMPTAISTYGWCHHMLPGQLKVGMPYQTNMSRLASFNSQALPVYDTEIFYAPEWAPASVQPDATVPCLGGGTFNASKKRCELTAWLSPPMANLAAAEAARQDLTNVTGRGLHMKVYEENGSLQGLWFSFKAGETACPYGAQGGWGQCRLNSYAPQLLPGVIYRVELSTVQASNNTANVYAVPFYYPNEAALVRGPNIVKP